MKIKVISDGTPNGTQVVDASNGQVIEGVVSVVIECYRDRPAHAFITLDNCRVEMVAKLDEPGTLFGKDG